MPKTREENSEVTSQKIRRRPGRGPTSCAECRRLKFRCDRKVPCAKCVSRGCESICPEGTLLPRKQNALALAREEELQDEIRELRSRNSDLEDALRSLQASVSTEPHPMLQTSPGAPHHDVSSNATQSGNHITPEPEAEPSSSTAEDESFVDAFGTLSLGPYGSSSFFGKTARAEYLMLALSRHQCRKNLIPTQSSKQLAEPVYLGNEVPDERFAHEIFSMLPPLPEALILCEVYQGLGKYMFLPVLQEELNEILLESYQTQSFEGAIPGQRYHGLALMFSIFAIGTYLDADQRLHSVGDEDYYRLARTALGFDLGTTQVSIQAYLHIGKYLYYSDSESTKLDLSWMYIGHAVRCGQSIGLQLDGIHWNLPQEEIQRRRRLFWQLFFFDISISFVSGRPPIMSTPFIDCCFPQDLEETIDANGEKHMSFHFWTQQYAILTHSIMETAFGATSPTYAVLLSLDRRVRNFPVPPYWRLHCGTFDHPPSNASAETNIQCWLILSRKEIVLVHLHRSYFARALQESPTDLPSHRYLPSVMAIYRSAWRLIRGLQKCWNSMPQAFLGTNISWSHGLSAAIVMCLIATRAPTSSMAPSALAELDALWKLFHDVAPVSPVVAKLLDTIDKLHCKAHELFNQASAQESTTLSPSELDRLGGKTHLLVDTSFPNSGPSYLGERTQIAGDAEKSALNFTGDYTDNMHPTIVQDMTFFDTPMSTYDRFFFDDPTVPFVSQLTIPNFSGFQNGLHPITNSQSYYQPPTGQGDGGLDQTLPPPILDAAWKNFLSQSGF